MHPLNTERKTQVDKQKTVSRLFFLQTSEKICIFKEEFLGVLFNNSSKNNYLIQNQEKKAIFYILEKSNLNKPFSETLNFSNFNLSSEQSKLNISYPHSETYISCINKKANNSGGQNKIKESCVRNKTNSSDQKKFNHSNNQSSVTLKCYDIQQQLTMKMTWLKRSNSVLLGNVCLQVMRIHLKKNKFAGSIKQKFCSWRPTFSIENEQGHENFQVKGPLFTNKNQFDSITFEIFEKDNFTVTGKIERVFKSYRPENYYINVQFPLGIDVNSKLLLIAAAFFIEYVYC